MSFDQLAWIQQAGGNVIQIWILYTNTLNLLF